MVYLVGAGPGDPGLITVRGLELIKMAEVLIYDRLGTNELMELTSDDCEKIYVGKQAGAHYRTQEEINRILIDKGRTGKLVVRLKGGDPFVFGRGGEEILALQRERIPFLVVPGITSAIAVPELLGIPVTHREISRSFHVVTGHTNAGSANDLSHIHRQEGTSVILMGLHSLHEIVEKLKEEGESENTPVAVISGGSLPNESMVKGCLGDICDLVEEAKLTSPAIIVVGSTASYELFSQELGVLRRKKIGVVGTMTFREKMQRKLANYGAMSFCICDMKVVPTNEIQELEEALEQIESYGWVCFTSQNAIALFFQLAKCHHIDSRRFAKLRFACVGSGTRDALLAYGFQSDYVPEIYTTKELALGLSKEVGEDQRILIPRAKKGSREMVEILTEQGCNIHVISIYDVVGTRSENWKYLNEMDVIALASASGVDAFVSELSKDTDIADWEEERRQHGVLVSAIGHVTAKALQQAGIKPDIVPAQCDLDHMIGGIIHDSYEKITNDQYY